MVSESCSYVGLSSLLVLEPLFFLGYHVGYKDYKVLDLDSNQLSISRDVIFHEYIFPFKMTLQLLTLVSFILLFYLLFN